MLSLIILKKILGGKVTDVKEQFSEEKYIIEFKGTGVAFANAVWGGWEMVNNEQLGKHHAIATIKLTGGTQLNDFLKGIINAVEIQSVNKVIPSMNEIFIRAVENESNSKRRSCQTKTQIKMGKIGLIIKREYTTRVKKKSFLLMTILGPILLVGFLVGAIWLGTTRGKRFEKF